ncbi:hypothetical protein JFT91_11310 [Pseudomonas sp. TH08]|uniref:hypothetical protein n=1 Tax=unclassified Pseudomonas TaxID=196821 RepID=UPI001912C8D0|nr:MULTISPECIES: hypothetical protein [unclassified Pseudomonas]MBK5528138.1 hypothetical protein [Pseudomonas sp. TH06]MBK5533186.1 hypothetical protein [Pseudomonas sp. TH08]
MSQMPKFTTVLVGAQVAEGRQLHLEAKFTPLQDVSIKVSWFKNGAPLQVGSRILAGLSAESGFVYLDSRATFPEDAGTYVCQIENSAGSAQTSCNVIVT